MNALELDVRLRHRDVVERPFQRFGVCTSCGRRRGEDGRPLFVTGRRRRKLECLECFDLGGAR